MRFKLHPFIVLLAAACCAGTTASAQNGNVGIGTTSPDPSAQLHIQSNGKGLLIPKLTLQQRAGISSPAEGLLIYQTNDTAGFYYYTSGAWTRLLNQSTLPSNITSQGNTFNTANTLVKLDAQGRLPAIDGSQLTNISSANAGALTTGTLSDARLSPNVTLAGNTFNAAEQLVKLDGAAKLPALDGSQLTNLSNINAGAITSGTIGSARLSTDVTQAGNSFNTANMLVKLDQLGKLPAVDGSQLTNLNTSSISGTVPVSKGGTGTGIFFTPGSVVYAGAGGTYSQNNNALHWSNDSIRLGVGTSKPYSRISLGKGAANTSESRLAVYEDSSFAGRYFYGIGLAQNPAATLFGLGLWGSSGNLRPGNGNDTTAPPHLFIANNGNIGAGTMNPAAKLDVAGSLKAASFTLKPGSAAGKILMAADTNGTAAWTSPASITGLDASTLGSGTLSDARLSTNVTQQGNTFNTAGKLVQVNSNGALPALNAENLTNLNAAALTGTVDNARLTNNVTLEGNSFNTANKLVKLDATGKLPAVDGSQLTNIDFSSLGTMPVNRGGTGTTTAFTAGSLVFAGANGTYSQDNSNLYWQKDSLRLGIGTSSPWSKISFGTTMPNTPGSRQAFHEDVTTGKYFYGVGFGKYGTIYGMGIWGGSGPAAPGDGTGGTVAPHLAVLSSGKVGIGTTAPSELLEVKGVIKAKSLKLTDGGVQAPYLLEGENGLSMNYYDTTSAEHNFVQFTGSGTINPRCGNFYRSASFVTQSKGKIVRISFLGPGTQAPFSIKLTRNTDGVVVGYVYNHYTPMNDPLGNWALPSVVETDSGVSYTLEIYKPDNILFSSCYYWPESGLSATVIGYKAYMYTGLTAKNGKVGVGTANPYSAISLGSSTSNTPSSQIAVYEDNDGKYFYGMNLASVGGSYGLGLYGSTGVNKPGDGVAQGTVKPQMLISGNGNFVNTYAPATFMEKVTFEGGIDIKGTARFWDGANWRSLTIGSCGGCTQVGYWVTSDRRFKTDIQNLGFSALDKISKINGYRYRYNHDSLKAHGYAADTLAGADQIGFIAQEVETMFPELVKTDSAGYKAVNYAQMTAVLVEAIKELKKENGQLRSDNAEMKAELNTRLAELEKKVLEMTASSATGKLASKP